MRGRLNATQIFLVYSIPALPYCMKNNEEREIVQRKLEHALRQGTEISDEELTRYFPKAITRRNDFVKKMNPTILNDRREMNLFYWREGHNTLLDVPEECWTHVGLLVRGIKTQKGVTYADCIGEKIGLQRFLVPSYHLDLQVNDIVSVHKRCIAEIFDGKNTRSGQ